jgi:hypothetical protein
VTEEVVVEGVDSVLAVVGHGGGERGCWLVLYSDPNSIK